MPPLTFFVPGKPIAMPRPRARSVGGRASVYHPRGIASAWRRVVAHTATQASQRRQCGKVPIQVSLDFAMPRPATKTWKRKPMPSEWRTGKPDCDNLAKTVLDACTGIIWSDDSLVVDLRVTKRMAAGDEEPGVTVTVAEAVLTYGETKLP